MMTTKDRHTSEINFEDFKKEVLNDYRLAHISRQCSLIARKEVLSGKAKFGIFGDGKEIAQIAMAKHFKNGDWRSGYYRDQTFLFATGMSDPREFFAQLYGDTDIDWNPGNGGRSFNNHYATRLLDENGDWKAQTEMKNTTADLSPTAAQMPRIIGLGYASKLYRENPDLKEHEKFSINGDEVIFGTIGDASTAEGHFFETFNAAAVLQIPVAVAVWDDGYGISVPKDYQIVKSSVSKALEGFKKSSGENGIYIYYGNGWDYAGLVKMFEEGINKCRDEHVPVLFHVDELTQPLGHSTSGSHERYKSKERLEWEREYDPLKKMREWVIDKEIAAASELDSIEEEVLKETRETQRSAWLNYQKPIRKERDDLVKLIDNRSCECKNDQFDKVASLTNDLKKIANPIRRDVMSSAKRILRHICVDCPIREELQADIGKWLEDYREMNYEKYSAYLYNESYRSALKVDEVLPEYSNEEKKVNAREVLRHNFDALFSKIPELVTFGEDTGKIGDVNKGLEGLQDKYGELRITDTGIRETTIIGQGIGLALRGLRPIAEIQYFDYLLYGLQTVSDDLASLHYRTKAGQAAPLIIRTRGHRLEGIWHSGSPLSMVINSIRGVYVCVPRDMTRAAGFYNTLLEADDPALVIEPLNAYRLKETLASNPGEFRVPLGVPEILEKGRDITLVTYGSCVRIAQSAVKQLKEFDIMVELIDVQTLLPFDIQHKIVESVKKTNRVVFFDEDVPGGATAFMMQKVIEEQKAFYYLDSEPVTLSAREHRPAYGSDGDYFSNPNPEDVFETIYKIMHESDPEKYPKIY